MKLLSRSMEFASSRKKNLICKENNKKKKKKERRMKRKLNNAPQKSKAPPKLRPCLLKRIKSLTSPRTYMTS